MQDQVEQLKANNKKPLEGDMIRKKALCLPTPDQEAQGYDGDDDVPASKSPPPPSSIRFFSQQRDEMIKEDSHRAVCSKS